MPEMHGRRFPDLPDLEIFGPGRYACNCRRITPYDVAEVFYAGAMPRSAEELHLAAQDVHLGAIVDGAAPLSTPHEIGYGFHCKTKACSRLFERAAQHLQSSFPHAVIPIAAATPRTGSCGNDCNTCATAASGCAPREA